MGFMSVQMSWSPFLIPSFGSFLLFVCASFCFIFIILFYYCHIEAVCFLLRYRKGVAPDERRGVKELRGVKEEETKFSTY